VQYHLQPLTRQMNNYVNVGYNYLLQDFIAISSNLYHLSACQHLQQQQQQEEDV